MTKEEAVVFLLEEGYKAYLDNSVVQIDVSRKEDIDKIFNKALKLLRDKGYEASFGVIAKESDDTDDKEGSSETKGGNEVSHVR